jgi:hypothetical protein
MMPGGCLSISCIAASCLSKCLSCRCPSGIVINKYRHPTDEATLDFIQNINPRTPSRPLRNDAEAEQTRNRFGTRTHSLLPKARCEFDSHTHRPEMILCGKSDRSLTRLRKQERLLTSRRIPHCMYGTCIKSVQYEHVPGNPLRYASPVK